MCFGGNEESTKTTNSNQKTNLTQTATPSAPVASAATQNLQTAQNLQNAGYTPYQGERVAPLSDLQNSALSWAGSSQIPDLINQYSTSTPGHVDENRAIRDRMAAYMSQYVEQALQPQLRLQQQQFDTQNRANDAAATSSGAFGDARAGIQAAQTGEAQDAQRQGLIANAYNTAFNTAIGAGAQDVANQQQAAMFNQQLREAALGRNLQGANNLEQYVNFLAQIGAIPQQQAQAYLNVPYSDYLAAQQYPFLTSQLLNQVTGVGAAAMPATTNTQGTQSGQGTTVVSQPDNSGFGILGALAGSAMKFI